MEIEYKKLRIFQADDNDLITQGVNKYRNIIEVLLPILNIDVKEYKIIEEDNLSVFMLDEAFNDINEVIDFQISAEDIEYECNNFNEVVDIIGKNNFDIYIIDLQWGGEGNAGNKLIDILKRKRIPKERIAFYSNHSDSIVNNATDIDYEDYKDYTHLSKKNLKTNFKAFFKKALNNLKKEIILNSDDGEINKIRKVLGRKEYSIFEGSIKYKNSYYKFKDLYLGVTDINNDLIAEDIRSFINTDNYDIIFPTQSCHLSWSKETYVKKYVIDVGNPEIFNYLDFCALNLFLDIYSKISKEDFLEEEYILDSYYLPKENPNPGGKSKLCTAKGWKKFYKILISRRVLLLWSEYFSLMDELNSIIGTNKFEHISRILYTGNNQPKETDKRIVDHLIRKNLSLNMERHSHFIKYIDNNSFEDEKRFLDRFSKEKLEAFFSFFKNFNDRTRKKYGHFSICYDFWDIKRIYDSSSAFGLEELFNDFKTEFKDEFDDHPFFDNNLKEIFFDNTLLNFESLLTKMSLQQE